jgi:agmatinase
MPQLHPDQFLGLRTCAGPEDADVVLVPLPFEKTVSYGDGTWRAPRAIIDASCQVETFDEETETDFEDYPRLHTVPAVVEDTDAPVEDYLASVAQAVRAHRDRFVLGIGGEHTVTYGMVRGLTDTPEDLTIVHIDAHGDLLDESEGRKWAHGTVMRRLWDEGVKLVQIGIRSVARPEYDFIRQAERLRTYFACRLDAEWPDTLKTLKHLKGDVYLSVDVDGLDPSVIPSTGTPQPNGLSWPQAMAVIRTVAENSSTKFIGADVVEFVASPHPPGCDITAARLVQKIIAFWARSQRKRS